MLPLTSIIIRLQPHVRANKIGYKLTWRENALKAGIGIKAAIKKAVTLLIDVRATLAPVRFKHSPVLSCKINHVSLKSSE